MTQRCAHAQSAVSSPRSRGQTRSAQASASCLEISSVEKGYAQRGYSQAVFRLDQFAQIIFLAPSLIGVFIANAPSAKSQYPKASGQSAEAVNIAIIMWKPSDIVRRWPAKAWSAVSPVDCEQMPWL